MKELLYLSDTALEGLGIAPTEIADAIEKALIAKSESRLHVASKSAVLPGDGRYMMSTLAVGADGLTVVKQVTVSPNNPSIDLPTINGGIMVCDAETGLLRAVMDANWITAHRTAALSLVAARRFAQSDAATIGMIGTGVQARSHLLAFKAHFPLETVFAYGRTPANVEAFCDFARNLGLKARAMHDPEQVLRASAIVVSSLTLDYTMEPFLDARWLPTNGFAAITDLCIPWISEGLTAFGTVIVDDLDQEHAAEKPMLPQDWINGDLTDLATGKAPVRHSAQPSAFAFRGIALGDYAAVALALRRAEEKGAGVRF